MTLDEGGWRRPNVRLIAPPAVLSDVVEFFWVDEWTNDVTRAHSFRIVADDAPHILWYLTGDELLRTQRMVIVGARARHHDVSLSSRRIMAGARLVPGSIPTLFGIPAIALTNRSFPVAVAASAPVAVRVRQMKVATRAGLVDDLSSLIELLRNRRVGDSRAAWIARRRRSELMTVESFARIFAMPPRSARAWSGRTLGMGLKRFLNIRRLHAALELRLSRTHETWGQVAAAAGYADQPHLIRDCRRLLGESPSEFLARGDERLPLCSSGS
jgi:AraC-like DNA-binding protein